MSLCVAIPWGWPTHDEPGAPHGRAFGRPYPTLPSTGKPRAIRETCRKDRAHAGRKRRRSGGIVSNWYGPFKNETFETMPGQEAHGVP
jgi:hypothetical protein